MKEFKHTPGPWQIDPDWGPCEKYPEWASIDIGEECAAGHIGAANAHLIAAAPELFEALDELANGYTGNGWDVGLVKRLEKARAAIAKALGETT